MLESETIQREQAGAGKGGCPGAQNEAWSERRMSWRLAGYVSSFSEVPGPLGGATSEPEYL